MINPRKYSPLNLILFSGYPDESIHTQTIFSFTGQFNDVVGAPATRFLNHLVHTIKNGEVLKKEA